MSKVKRESKRVGMKRIPAIICIFALMFAIMGTGCGKQEEVVNTITPTTSEKSAVTAESSTQPVELSEVDLKWYVLTNPQPDDALIYGEANKYIKEKINATVDFIPLNGGEYQDKISVKMASGEDMDVVFTSSWLNNFMDNISKGSLVALDEMLDTVAPRLKAQIPQKYWDIIKVKKMGDDKAKIWAVPNYQIEVGMNGLAFKKDLVDKYNLTDAIKNAKTMDDLTPIFKTIYDNEKGVTCIVEGTIGHYDISGAQMPNTSWIASCLIADNKTFKVLDKYEDEEFIKQYTVAREWNQKGYLDKNAMIIKDIEPLKKAGKLFCYTLGSTKPGVEVEEKAKYDYDIVVKSTNFPSTSQGSVTATMNGIVKASKNPERALMLLELVNTDKYLYNLLNFGIEKTHYSKIDDNTIEVLAGSKFNPGMAWALGNQFNAFVQKGQPADVWEQTMALNEKAELDGFGSFSFNTEPVKTELAQIQAIEATYEKALYCGALDPVKGVATVVEKIKKNDNLKKVIDECQKQMDEWKAAQNQ